MAACQISISRISDGLYELRIKTPSSRGRRSRITRRLPPDFSDLVADQPCNEPSRTWRRPPSSIKRDDLLFCAGNLATLKEIGGRLFDSLFLPRPEDPATEGDDFTTALLTVKATVAESGGGGVAIDLSEAPELSRIPWEALYFARDDLLLGIDSGTNIVRILEWDSAPPAAVEPPLRLLVAVANIDSELEAGTEIGDLEKRLGNLLRESETSYEIAKLPRATRVELQDRIEEWRPHIIHFIGHGGFDDEQGLIYLHGSADAGGRDPVDSATLRDLVSEHPPWLVVLNSCLSGAAARADPFAGAAQNLIRANVPFVVAMQAPISDDAAIRFSQRFYSSLISRETVATAVTRGRHGIRMLADTSLQAELITPVLYSNGTAERIAIVERPARSTARSISQAVMADLKRSGIIAGMAALLGVVLAVWLALSSRDAPPSAQEGWAAGRGDGTAEMSTGPADAADGDEDTGFAMNDLRSDALEARSDALEARSDALAAATGDDLGPVPEASLAAPSPAPALAPPWAAAAPERQAPALAGSREATARQARERPRLRASRREPNSDTLSTAVVSREPVRLTGTARVEARAAERQAAAEERYLELLAQAAETGDYLAMAPPSRESAGPARAPDLTLAAVFAAASSAPIPLTVERLAETLLSPAGAPISIELVGGVDPDYEQAEPLSAAAAEQLGSARAESVAAALRVRGVAGERIATASAGMGWTETRDDPALGRGVEARLALPGANRIRFAPDSAEPGADGNAALDRLASFARENPQFLLLVEGHSDDSEGAASGVDRRRAERVAEGMRQRGVEAARILTRFYSYARPEMFGVGGPDANRRAQIVPVPISPGAPDPDPR